MYKIEGVKPTPYSDVEDIADYIECQTIKGDERVSIHEIVKPILIVSDEANGSGIDDDDAQFQNRIDEVIQEIDRRSKICNSRYPFIVENSGYTLKANKDEYNYWVYIYLLLSTRLNMRDRKTLEDIDGTEILEYLSAEVAKQYFGPRSDSIVFGTALDGTFSTKINDLCSKVGEGVSFENRNNTQPTAQDDKLDIVAWKSFTDANTSKLIGFGQCKTGMSWTGANLSELQPNVFCQKWLRNMPVHNPVKMFFCSYFISQNQWYTNASDGGIIFDRFRIIDFLPEALSPNLLVQIKTWSTKAIEILVSDN